MEKAKRYLCVFLSTILFFSVFLFTGCGNSEESPLTGSWAYIHDTSTPVLVLKSNGKAEFNGSKYNYETDDDFITLSSGGHEKYKMRYLQEDDGFLLYETTVYEYADEGDPDSIFGTWYSKATGWSFEFTEEGTFNEDGYFPGYYSLNEADSTIKLIYNDHFEDTLLYYSLSDHSLTIEYPWKMVRSE